MKTETMLEWLQGNVVSLTPVCDGMVMAYVAVDGQYKIVHDDTVQSCIQKAMEKNKGTLTAEISNLTDEELIKDMDQFSLDLKHNTREVPGETVIAYFDEVINRYFVNNFEGDEE